MIFQVLLGVAIGYLFKPQIDKVVDRFRNKKKNDNWDE